MGSLYHIVVPNTNKLSSRREEGPYSTVPTEVAEAHLQQRVAPLLRDSDTPGGLTGT